MAVHQMSKRKPQKQPAGKKNGILDKVLEQASSHIVGLIITVLLGGGLYNIFYQIPLEKEALHLERSTPLPFVGDPRSFNEMADIWLNSWAYRNDFEEIKKRQRLVRRFLADSGAPIEQQYVDAVWCSASLAELSIESRRLGGYAFTAEPEKAFQKNVIAGHDAQIVFVREICALSETRSAKSIEARREDLARVETLVAQVLATTAGVLSSLQQLQRMSADALKQNDAVVRGWGTRALTIWRKEVGSYIGVAISIVLGGFILVVRVRQRK